MTDTTAKQPEGFPRRHVSPETVLRGAALGAALGWIAKVRYGAARTATDAIQGHEMAQQLAAKRALDGVSTELPPNSAYPGEEELVWIIWADHYAARFCNGDDQKARLKLRDDYKRFYKLLTVLLNGWQEACLHGATPYDELFAMMHFLLDECAWEVESAHKYLVSLHQENCPSCTNKSAR